MMTIVPLDLTPSPTLPAPAPPAKPLLTVRLGQDVAAKLPPADDTATRAKFVEALRRQLAHAFPDHGSAVLFFDEATSTLEQPDGADSLLAAVGPIILAVIGDPTLYGWGIDPLASPGEAVTYLLNRAQEDPDLGYLIGPGSQTFRLLCEAEAWGTRRPLIEVVRARSKGTSRPRQYFTRVDLDRQRGKGEA